VRTLTPTPPDSPRARACRQAAPLLHVERMGPLTQALERFHDVRAVAAPRAVKTFWAG
jgi:hypothetical protein